MDSEWDGVEESDEVPEEDHHEWVDRHLLGHHVTRLIYRDTEDSE